ncbi:hypothetical protein S40288_10191 [Stachybotrys chartarum IBT 40288]|nr:hypothetical protein S40288_10191 [Stachybotrys chartarum IBT 40288]
MASSALIQVYNEWISCVNRKEWGQVGSLVNSPVSLNDDEIYEETHSLDTNELVAYLKKRATSEPAYQSAEVDIITSDNESECIAVHLIVNSRVQQQYRGFTSGMDIYHTEQHFVWFTNGKISRIIKLADIDKTQAATTSGLDLIRDFSCNQGSLLTKREMEHVYACYLACVTNRRIETDLAQYCNNQVTLAGNTLDLPDFITQIMQSVSLFPDLSWALEDIVVDEKTQRMAIRVQLSGTPAKEQPALGLFPSKVKVSFTEHVVCQLVDEKIARTWNIIDWANARKQLSV